MGKVVVLGSACAVPDETHENTYLALAGAHGSVLIDCASQPVVRLGRAGLAFELVSDVVLTHFHPDHVAGLPGLIVEMWLRGRRQPLRVHGLRQCLEPLQSLMQAYGWQAWEHLYPVSFHVVAAGEQVPVVETDDFSLTASSVRHLVPGFGVRVKDRATGRELAYSSDTQPCAEVVDLACGVDLLIHEATGPHPGHSSAAQAGEMARQAGARRLVLIHYQVNGADTSRLVGQAAETFGGPVLLAEDFMELEF